MSTLNEFISDVKANGLIPNNRYEVTFIPPVKIGNNDLKSVMMYCDSLSLPGLNISTQQARTYGEVREMPYERLFDNVNMTFYVDNYMTSKHVFDIWLAAIQDPSTRQLSWYNDYITDMTITVLDKEDKPVYVVNLYECYPKSVSAITMDYSSKDVMKLQVSMNYKYWTSSSIEEGQSSVDSVIAPVSYNDINNDTNADLYNADPPPLDNITQ